MHTLVTFLLTALVAAGVTALARAGRSRHRRKALRRAIGGLLSVNGLAVLACIGLVVLSFGSPVVVRADEAGAPNGQDNSALAAAIATGVACIGAGIAVAVAGAAPSLVLGRWSLPGSATAPTSSPMISEIRIPEPRPR